VLVLAGLILGAWLLERGFLSPANRWIRDLYAKPPAGAPVAEPPAHAERSLV
jgi:peptidoglycan/LPS O-acetylase OafA/YrhL